MCACLFIILLCISFISILLDQLPHIKCTYFCVDKKIKIWFFYKSELICVSAIFLTTFMQRTSRLSDEEKEYWNSIIHSSNGSRSLAGILPSVHRGVADYSTVTKFSRLVKTILFNVFVRICANRNRAVWYAQCVVRVRFFTRVFHSLSIHHANNDAIA